MSIERDDPRLTQYALGEMAPAAHEAFEKELAKDPAARAEVESIRALAACLSAELGAEAAPALEETQRRAVEKAAGGFRGFPAWFTVAAAACLAGVVGTALYYGSAASVQRASKENRVVARERAAQIEPVAGITTIPQPAKSSLTPGKPATEVKVVHNLVEGRAKEQLRVGLGALNNPKLKNEGASTLFFESRAGAAEVNRRWREVQSRIDDAKRPGFSREAYDRIRDNSFVRVADEHTSTFSIDVDTASYANVRRFLSAQNRLPPPDAVRIEELVNYFRYDYAPPPAAAEHPFAARMEIATCPWTPEHRLARIAIKGKEIEVEQRPATNFVFLVDVSGSMRPANKLPLLKQGLRLLVEQLDEGDRVAMAVYAGAAGLVLESTPCNEKEKVLAALQRLEAGGSTNGGAGIQLAYDVARKNFIKGGANRVILCTDGDFNVGISDQGSLTRLIEEEAKSNVYLSVLGFGTGNYQDARMEALSNHGNGNYYYIDTLAEARKVFVEEMTGTLVTIAKDVKIQVFFNPKMVAAYRLVGYENRMLHNQDFNDDTKDAGEIGAGHTVTALYELVPAGADAPVPPVDDNPFVKPAVAGSDSKALLQLRLRYKHPEGDTSTLMEEEVFDAGARFEGASPDFQWAVAVAAFGMGLRDSPHKGQITWDGIHEIAKAAMGTDPQGHRAEFLTLVQKAKALSAK